MSIQISFHEYEVEFCREDIDYYACSFRNGLQKIGNPAHPNLTLQDIAEDAISSAGLLSQFRPCCSDMGNALLTAARALNGHFRLARYPKNKQRIEVFVPPAEPLMLTTTGPSGSTDARNWIKAFHLGMIVHEPDILDDLCRFPTDLMRESSNHGVHVGEFTYAQVEMLKAFWRGDPELEEYALKAFKEASDAATLTESFIDYAVNIASYEISLFIRVHVEKELFNTDLAEAIERHKKHYFIGKDKVVNDSRVFLALGPLAMCALAHERGIPIEVESAYIPRCVIEDKYVRQPEDEPLRV
jgi:Immunity protein 49